MTYQLIAPTAFGLEAVTARELTNLGFADVHTEDGRVFFTGDADGVARANLWLRTAARVQICLAKFRAVTFEELFQGVKAIPWGDWLPEDARFPVDGRSVKSTLFSISDCQAIAKKAVESGIVEMILFSMNPAFDLLPATEDSQLMFEAEYDASLSGISPDRAELYKLCEQNGVGITVMKAYGGGRLFRPQIPFVSC